MDFRQKISKEQYIYLKTLLKTSAEAGSLLRKAAESEKDLVRYNLRNLKRIHGHKTRIYLLALAFLRGRKYSDVEPNCQSPVCFVAEIRDILLRHCSFAYKKQIDTDLKIFFTKSETTSEQAA